MQPPSDVSGYPITPRGVHLHPNGLHDYWMDPSRRQGFFDTWRAMGISWVVAKSASDNFLLSGAAEACLQNGIIPIIRFDYQFPDQWTHGAVFQQFVDLCAQYGAPGIGKFANEPFDAREWRNGTVPPEDEAWIIIRDRWLQACNEMIDAGGYAMFPDGPCYDRNPFKIIGDQYHFWKNGLALYGYHGYFKGRPYNYPEDDVSRNGTPLTWDEYVAALDDYGSDPAWNEGPYVLELMNAQRQAWKDATKTAVDDPTCWRGWQRVQHYAQQAFGHNVQMALVEGGSQPRDRAGSAKMTRDQIERETAAMRRVAKMGNLSKHGLAMYAKTLAIDIRWPYTTPNRVADNTMLMEADRPPEMFAVCPWLYADKFMAGGGDVGWPYDAWDTWAYTPPYPLKKPVVARLIANPPGGSGNGDLIAELQAALVECQATDSFLQAALDELTGKRGAGHAKG